jgi:magnesium transporter
LDALKSQPLSVLVVKESTAPLQMQMTKQELTQQCKISARDLRAIDPTFRRQLSSILPRSSCIIVNLGPIKSIIMFDRVLLFEPNSIHIKQLLPLLQSRLSPNAPISASLSPQSATSNGTLPPFELRALEVLLIHTCHHFDSALARLMPEIDYVLDALYTQSSSSLSSSLQRLLPLKKALSNFIASVDESNHAVSAVLDSDEDMAEMYITTKQMLGHRRRIDQHQEVEVLLETYHAQLMEVQHRASQVKVTIQSTQDILNIHLADVRNELMRFNLLLTSGAFAIACGSIISGIFGMNLLSTFEDSRYAFAIVSGSIALVSSTVFFTALRYCLKKKIL